MSINITPGYSIQGNDSDDETERLIQCEQLQRSDGVARQDVWQTPAETFVQPSAGFLETARQIKQKLYGGDTTPKRGSPVQVVPRARSASYVEQSSHRSLPDSAETPTWTSRARQRISRCSVTHMPIDRTISRVVRPETFVQPSAGFLETARQIKQKLYGGDTTPKRGSPVQVVPRARSASYVEQSSHRSLPDSAETPTWTSRARQRISRCSVTHMPIDRTISSDEGVSDSTDSHCHSQLKKSGFDKKARTKLILASILCLMFMTGEMVGGLLAHSLAIISDAAHLLTDFASFMISLMALYLAHRPATKKLSFGWYRIEILGAFLSILMLWVLTGILVYSAVLRIMEDTYKIDAEIMLITAATGVAFNIVLGTTLHQHSHSHGGHGHSHGGGDHSHGGGGHSHGGGGHSNNGGGHSQGGAANKSEGHDRCDEGHSDDEDGPGHGHSDEGCSRQAHPSEHWDDYPEVFHDRGVPGKAPGVAPEVKTYGSIDAVEKGHHNGGLSDERSPLIKREGHKSHKKETNINVKAAFIHVIGDLLQSVGVLVAAFIIYYKPEWKIADPICTFMFSLFVLVTTFTIMKDIIVVLMEGTPRGINFAEVREAFFQVEGVLDIHNLRVWSLTMDKIALSVHLAIDKKSDPHKVLKMASLAIQQRFNISETTMQVEQYVDEMMDCQDCQGPKL